MNRLVLEVLLCLPVTHLLDSHHSTTVSPPSSPKESKSTTSHPGVRVNKFVRRFHDMLQAEKYSGIVEWRRGLLVLHSTDAFTKKILPRYFNTRNFKTFRRQMNYYGFTHGKNLEFVSRQPD